MRKDIVNTYAQRYCKYWQIVTYCLYIIRELSNSDSSFKFA